MEDLSQTLQEILGSKEGQEKLKHVAEMLSSGNDSSGGGLDLSKLGSLLGGKEEQPTEPAIPDFSGLDLNMILKIQQMMGKFQSNDKNTELILALKPHLRPERQKKEDDAIKMMRLISLLPMLKESGLFGTAEEQEE